MKFQIVPISDVDRVWGGLAKGMIESCRETGGAVSAGWLWQECRSGHAFLVIGFDDTDLIGGIVVQFQQWEQFQVLRGLGMCGISVEHFPELATVLREFAKAGGAEWFVDSGRPALAKIIEGAEVTSVNYRVKI